MISRLIGGFVAILIGVSLIGPVAEEVNTAVQAGVASEEFPYTHEICLSVP